MMLPCILYGEIKGDPSSVNVSMTYSGIRKPIIVSKLKGSESWVYVIMLCAGKYKITVKDAVTGKSTKEEIKLSESITKLNFDIS